MVRRLLLLASVLLGLGSGLIQVWPAGAAGGPGWFAGLPDLPLMPGLKEVPDAQLHFDKPGGRLVEGQARGKVGRDKALAFYRDSLPQLGWMPAESKDKSRLAFIREGETLDLTFTQEGGDLVVTFAIRPQGATGP